MIVSRLAGLPSVEMLEVFLGGQGTEWNGRAKTRGCSPLTPASSKLRRAKRIAKGRVTYEVRTVLAMAMTKASRKGGVVRDAGVISVHILSASLLRF